MIQCENCEFAEQPQPGKIVMRCNPFTNVKEEACLLKWQLLKVETMVQAYQATVQMYQRLAPLQEKMFRQIQREVEDIDEADSWKRTDEDGDEEEKGEG
jgi:E3 ubiquitin-protein ligase DOA10